MITPQQPKGKNNTEKYLTEKKRGAPSLVTKKKANETPREGRGTVKAYKYCSIIGQKEQRSRLW